MLSLQQAHITRLHLLVCKATDISETREIFATQLESLLPEEMYLLGFFLNIEMKRLVFQ